MRSSIVILVTCSACGSGVVRVMNLTPNFGPSGGGVVRPASTEATGASPSDAGGSCLLHADVISAFSGDALPGVGIRIDPGGQTLQAGADGSCEFEGLWPGSYTLTASDDQDGYPPRSATVTLSDDGSDCSGQVTLMFERSRPLDTGDAGWVPDWMAFAPDGGPLYAADDTSLWRLPADGSGAERVETGLHGVLPLGFSSSGSPVILDHDDPRLGYRSFLYDARIIFTGDGGAEYDTRIEESMGAPLVGQTVFLVADEVLFASDASLSPSGDVLYDWSIADRTRLASNAAPWVLSAPVPAAYRYGWAAYERLGQSTGGTDPTFVLPDVEQFCSAAACAQPSRFLPSGAMRAGQPRVLGVSPDGAFLAFSVDTSQIAVLSPDVALLAPQPASQFASLTALVPVTSSRVVELFDGGTAIVQDLDGGSTPFPATAAFPLPDGSLVLDDPDAGLRHGPNGPATEFDYPWAQPVVAPGGAFVAFEGTPAVLDVKAWAAEPLDVTPASLAFSPDGRTLLVVGEDHTLHAFTVCPGAQPIDQPLEGDSSLALFTPDGQSIVYAGQDPNGGAGVFVQDLASQTSPCESPEAAPDGGGS